ncbi:hypothetical protein FRAHR75_180017 [Frankia sp. Hr75.2]|nr:hypothetical protein FRAHR75_180017 [Frankia sp. Hr75.2]
MSSASSLPVTRPVCHRHAPHQIVLLRRAPGSRLVTWGTVYFRLLDEAREFTFATAGSISLPGGHAGPPQDDRLVVAGGGGGVEGAPVGGRDGGQGVHRAGAAG